VAVGTKFMLEVNAAAILTRLRAAHRASVSFLAKETGLSRQAVTRSVAVLESMGLVELSAPDRAAAAAGRPPQMVRFRADAGRLLGVDVKPRAVRIVVADLAGDINADETVPLSRSSADAVAVALRAAVLEVLGRCGVGPDVVWHVSAAAPGIVDPATRHVTLSPSMPSIVGDTILAGIQAAVDAPVSVDNDVKLATEGEQWHGAPHAEDSLVFIDWGERIGAGIVLRGELYRGASNDAGDIGYLDLVAPDAGTGGDEDLGPFERWVGSRELLRIADVGLTLPELMEAAHRGDPPVLAAVRTVGQRFAKGIAAIRAVLDPEVIVIGGDLAGLGQVLLDVLAEALRSEQLGQPRLEISTLGADAIIHGAIRHSLAWVERERFDVPAIRRG
jgi:predicted NBD/HSP70 family sugar kinase